MPDQTSVAVKPLWRRILARLWARKVVTLFLLLSSFVLYSNLTGLLFPPDDWDACYGSNLWFKVISGAGEAENLGIMQSGSFHLRSLRPLTNCFVLLISGVVASACTALLVRRFSLRALLAAFMVVGMLGSLPFLVERQQVRSAQLLICLGTVTDRTGQTFPVGGEKEIMLAALTPAVRPAVALTTLPPRLREKLAATPDYGLESVEVRKDAEGRDSVMVMFTRNASSAQRRLLTEFYINYSLQVIADRFSKQGTPSTIKFSNEDLFPPWIEVKPDRALGDWNDYRREWETEWQRRQQQQTAAAKQ